MHLPFPKRMILVNYLTCLMMFSLMFSTSQQALAKTNQDILCNGGGRKWSSSNGNGATNKCWTGINHNDYYGQAKTTSSISVAVLKVRARGYQTTANGIIPGCDKTSGTITGYLSVTADSPTANVVACGGENHNYWAIGEHWAASSHGFSYNP